MKNKIKFSFRFKKNSYFLLLAAICIIIAIESYFLIHSANSSYLKNQEDYCKTLSKSKKQQCWQETIKNIVAKQGVDEGFKALSFIYNKNPDFSSSCHGITHDIGYSAYDLFRENKKVTISKLTSSCNFGFYHGFMEKLMIHENNIKKAREFCHYVDSQLKHETTDAGFQCFHGIGHGMVNADDNPAVWGDDVAITEPVLKLCEKVKENEEDLYRCVSGVFNGLANFYLSGEYGLKPHLNNPSQICDNQPDKYKEACYGNMNSVVLSTFKGDFVKAAEFEINHISPKTFIPKSIEYLSEEWVGRNIESDDFKTPIEMCRKIPVDLKYNCLNGVEKGYFESGSKPEYEYVRSLSFCKTKELSSEEKDNCYKFLLGYIPHQYSDEKMQKICLSVDKEYQKYCIKVR